MAFIPSENGAKVTLIKKKFEGTMCDLVPSNPDQKDTLRRSLSASPVKVKKNFKLNVTRQFSNPSKNIKRTPAFRGDKFLRVKQLHFSCAEKSPSLVHKNVKIFEETPDNGKIANVKKKKNVEILNSTVDEPSEKKISEKRDNSANLLENTVRTTVISRHKNIYPLRTEQQSIDDPDFSSLLEKRKTEKCENVLSPSIEKFLINGVEYTQVFKHLKSKDKSFQEARERSPDPRVELSRRIFEENASASLELTETLKAALQAPLPSGPPPKKPPRTFAHSPLAQRSNPAIFPAFTSPKVLRKPLRFVLQTSESDVTDFTHKNSVSSASTNDDDLSQFKNCLKSSTNSFEIREEEDQQKKLNTSKEPRTSRNFDFGTHPNESTKNVRDSKKMLEKLETVLVQHQKALGPKVIMPRGNRSEISNDCEPVKSQRDLSSIENNDEKNDKKSFFTHRLLRTVESDEKLKEFRGLKAKKYSPLEYLPYLNCASTTVYEQPTFKHYCHEDLIAETKCKPENSLSSSIENILNSSGLCESLSPGARRFSTEFTTFLEGKRKARGGAKNEERVYAEPFLFDKNSGTDITELENLSREGRNYLSNSWYTDGSSKGSNVEVEKETYGRDQSAELHYLIFQMMPQ